MNNNDTNDKKFALISAMMGSFLSPFLSSSVNIAIPTIEFHMSAVTMSWITTSLLLASAVFVVPFGKISDIYGRKRIYNIGMFIILLSCIISAVSLNAEMLIFSRAMQGLGSGMTFATGLAIVTSLYAPNERGKAIGWIVSVVYIGLSLGPFLGGIITQNFGWRALFLINLPFAIIGLVYGFKIKNEWKIPQSTKFDYSGALTYILSTVFLIIGFSRVNTLIGVIVWLLGLLGFVLFAFIVSKKENPILDISLFRKNKLFALSNLASLINYSTTFSVSFLMSFYLQTTKGMTASQAGTILVSQPIIMAILTPYTGKLSDKYNPSLLSSIGMGITCIGLLFLAFVEIETQTYQILIYLLLVGLGFALFSSPNMNVIMGSVEKKELSAASSISSTTRLLGQMMSMGLTMLVIAYFVGDRESLKNHPDGLMQTIHFSYILFTILSLIGIFASLFRGNKNNGANS